MILLILGLVEVILFSNVIINALLIHGDFIIIDIISNIIISIKTSSNLNTVNVN